MIIACDHPIHPKAQEVIEECRASARGDEILLDPRTGKPFNAARHE